MPPRIPPGLQKAIDRAKKKIEEMFKDPYKLGQQVGETAFMLGRDYVMMQGRRISLEYIKSYYKTTDGSINDAGNGVEVARIYQGDDSNFYKAVGDYTLVWDGNDWVEV